MTPGSVLIFFILPVLLDCKMSKKRSGLFFFSPNCSMLSIFRWSGNTHFPASPHTYMYLPELVFQFQGAHLAAFLLPRHKLLPFVHVTLQGHKDFRRSITGGSLS